MIKAFFIAIPLILLTSCGGNQVKNINFQELKSIELGEFKKKNVKLNSSLRFLNENEAPVFFKRIEFDAFVDGKDAGTYVVKENKKIPKNGVHTQHLNVNFKPEKVFDNLDYGLIKIKSDIVADVKFEGYFVVSNEDGDEEEIRFTKTQKVLFSNSKKLKIDKNGKLIE